MLNKTHKLAPAPPRHPTAYREVKVGNTLYRITSVFTGEKELGPTLENLATKRVLAELDGHAKTLLQN